MKMRTILQYLIPAAAAAFLALSCADNRNEHLDEFATIAYFRNGGDQELSLYRTGEPFYYTIPVCKAGSDRNGTIDVEVIPFSEAQLAAYNIKYQTDYKLIPQNLYEFVTSDDPATATALANQSKVDIAFGASDFDALVYLRLDVNGVSALMEANPEEDFRLILQLFSNGMVNKEGNLILLSPAVDIPRISFVNASFDHKIYAADLATITTFSNSLSLNMDKNDWDFDCVLKVMDQTWLNKYNTENGTDYVLLPASCYSFDNQTLSFQKGSSLVSFEVTVDPKHADYQQLMEYVIPVRIASCTKTEFIPDEATYMVHTRVNPAQIPLDAAQVTVSANEAGDGNGAPALVDDDTNTYWHSPWSGYVTNADPDYGIYIDIALASPLRRFALNYRTRSGNANGVPVAAALGVSTDGTTWTKVSDIDLALLDGSAAAGTWVSLPAVKQDASFNYIRFGLTAAKSGDLTKVYARGSQPFVSLSEIQLYGVN